MSVLFLTIDFEHAAINFPDKSKRLVVNSCHLDIQFMFTSEEYNRLCDCLNQAIALLEVKEILS